MTVARPSALRRALIALLAIIFLALLALGVGAWVATDLAGDEPSWWATTDTGEDPDAPRTALRLEQGIATALHESVPDGEPWAVRMKEEDLNAWLTHRLEPWLENRSLEVSDSFGAPRVRVRDGRFTVGLPSPDPRVKGIFTVEFTPTVGQDGQLTAGDRAYSLGRLPLPDPSALGAMSGDLRKAAAGTALEPFVGALLDTSAALPAEVTLHDRRLVRLLDLALDDEGHMDFTLVTTR